MKLYIKNMVCDRCRMVVRQTFEDLGMTPEGVELGEVEVNGDVPDWSRLQQRLEQLGFELLEDKRKQLVTQIKRLVLAYINQPARQNLSDYLAEQLNREYSALSKLFSESEQQTIEQYVIRLKIEKAKELLSYRERNLSEIADELGYSSVAHLSNQFKKVTGVTPSQFRSSEDVSRQSLDQI
ncbi:AraC family transcriptional regulator [Siphonobacter sp. BAB-5405]|uniref:helix-turn-helix domain-containing protein n=1 Tax=Siphonobacter sp. BAB-5405 TaxID=1864825 RepID=UPI000C800BD0|nr:AraC family transcriptional regulator [Siphonobacter sp. BAB-5405]PMD97520.1 AraC family transcriptional regulator [Siphonobacter sp. BAB-5405]